MKKPKLTSRSFSLSIETDKRLQQLALERYQTGGKIAQLIRDLINEEWERTRKRLTH